MSLLIALATRITGTGAGTLRRLTGSGVGTVAGGVIPTPGPAVGGGWGGWIWQPADQAVMTGVGTGQMARMTGRAEGQVTVAPQEFPVWSVEDEDALAALVVALV